MAKKHIEPFNPWPGFVDLFASVIMVVLIFMLVLIINITYYAQFKYKISYTGSVAVQQLVNQPVKKTQESKELQKKDALIQEEEKKVDDNSTKDLEAVAGIDLTIADTNLTRQENIIYDDWMIVKYLDKEIILDPKSLKDVENFLKMAKSKYPNHYVSVFVQEPSNQISASVSKQIALSRAINIRNLIRSKEYNTDDVVVRLKEQIPQAKQIEHASGYGIIIINKKR